jgi:hypothetical protein
MGRLLTSHEPAFRQEGLFFEALLGLVSSGRKLRVFLLGASDPSKDASSMPLDLEREVGPASVAYCLLGVLSIQQRASELVRDWASQAALPIDKPRARPPRGDLLK